MCGICGITKELMPEASPEEKVRNMMDSLHHRGPDEEGTFIEDPFALGIKRLALVGIDDGRQPFFSEDRRFVVVFNGEIYNHKELKEELIKAGHTFSSKSDGEVIIHLFEEYSTKSFRMLDGMFAFALLDLFEKSIYLVRDQFGIKPLYYYHDNGIFAFASEVKAILTIPDICRDIDLNALNLYMCLEYMPTPLTGFKFIKKVPPGSYFHYKLRKKCEMKQYWGVDELAVKRQNLKDPDIQSRLSELLHKSVKLRKRADVEIGLFLSGGIDSSSLLYMMREEVTPVKTFSAIFEETSFDERQYAREISKLYNTEHQECLFSEKEMLNIIPEALKYLDEPLADPSFFSTYFLSKLAKNNVKAVFSGEGGDEIFCGYPTYTADKLCHMFSLIPDQFKVKILRQIEKRYSFSEDNLSKGYKLDRMLRGLMFPYDLRPLIWKGALLPFETRELFTNDALKSIPDDSLSFFEPFLNKLSSKNYLCRHQLTDISTYLLDDLLVKADRASMANSIETRLPFLDTKIVEFVFSLPNAKRLPLLNNKALLKKIMKKHLPDSILNRPKKGFGIPLTKWLSAGLKDFVSDTFESSKLVKDSIIRKEYVDKIFKKHLLKKRDMRKEIWTVLIAELWYRRYSA